MKFEQPPIPPKRKKPGMKEKLAAGLIAITGAAGGAEQMVKHVPESGARVTKRKEREEDPDFDQLSPENSVQKDKDTLSEI